MSIKREAKTVVTMTPQRISFVGGGTDLPRVYESHGGSVVSTAIDKYIYVTVKKHSELFDEQYRLNYSITEHVQSLEEIKNDIARECLRLVPVDSSLYISTVADIPASSGLGSSSSFAVGLLNALHILRGERVSPVQLAEEACKVEIDILKNPIGKQDQYAAAFGGLNHFVFKQDGRVLVDPIFLEPKQCVELFNNLVLIWTGIQRDASAILKLQNDRVGDHQQSYVDLLSITEEFKIALLSPPAEFIKIIGSILERSWKTKRKLEQSISSSSINDLHDAILNMGGLGGKLSGAGGGGFLLEILPDNIQNLAINLLGKKRVLNIQFEPLGSRVISEIYE
jgi:D-glycero-alpha-D-manno-heptose-7-phosphate kinase